MWPILPASESSAPCRKFAIRERSCHQARQANVAPGTFFRAFLRTRCLNQGFRERTFSSQSRTTNAARPSSSSPNTGSSREEPISKLVRRYSCATPGKISCTRSRYHLPFCANKTTSPTATSRSRTLCKTNSSPGKIAGNMLSPCASNRMVPASRSISSASANGTPSKMHSFFSKHPPEV